MLERLEDSRGKHCAQGPVSTTQGRRFDDAGAPLRRRRGCSSSLTWVAVPVVAALSLGCTRQLGQLQGNNLGEDSEESSPPDSTEKLTTSPERDKDAGVLGTAETETRAPWTTQPATFESRGDAGDSTRVSSADASSGSALEDSGSTGEDMDTSSSTTDTGTTGTGSSTSLSESSSTPCGDGAQLCLVETTPAHAEEGIATDTHLVLRFNRAVVAEDGELTVSLAVGETTFERVPLADPRVNIEGEVVTLDLDGILGGETEYSVSLTPSAFSADGGATFAGISHGEWTFTTQANELPVPDDQLVLWVDSSMRSSIKLQSERVAVLGDRSGQNNTLRQSSSDARPELTSVTWTEHDVLRFDGTDVLTASSLTSGFEQTDLFVVWRSPITPSSTLTTLFSHGVMDAVQAQLTHGHSVTAYRHAAITRYTSGVYYALQFDAPAANTTYLWNASFNGNRLDIFVNGTSVTGMDVTDEPKAPSEVMALGGGPAGNYAFNGSVAEVVYFGRSLSSSERTQMSDYLEQKWGL